MPMQCVQAVPRDGLGLPIVPVVIGAVSAIGGLFRGAPKVTEEDAKSAVRQIYLELLEREPDAGAQGYIDCLYKGAQHDPSRGWCDVDFIRTELLKSQEYRDLQARKAAAVYGAPAPAAGFAPGGALPTGEGISTMTIAGIPIVYLAGGLALLMLLRRS